MRKTKIVVIIVNYNNYMDTLRCVRELDDYSNVDSVIIVDNFSSNNSVKKIKKITNKKNILIELKKNTGFASGNNAGLLFAIDKYGSDCIVFISNPDVKVGQDAIENVAQFIERNIGNAGIVAPRASYDSAWKYLSITKRLFVENVLVDYISMKKSRNVKMYPNYKNELPVDVVSGAFFAMYGKTWESINFFDGNTFLYYEEEILYKKLHKIGKQNYQLGNVKYEHVGHSSTGSDGVLMTKRMNKSRMYLLDNYENLNFFQHVSVQIMNKSNVLVMHLNNLKKKYYKDKK